MLNFNTLLVAGSVFVKTKYPLIFVHAILVFALMLMSETIVVF